MVDWALAISVVAIVESTVVFFVSLLPRLGAWWNERKGKIILKVDFVDGAETIVARGLGPLSLPLRIQERSGFDVSLHRVIVRSAYGGIQFENATVGQHLAGVKFVDPNYMGFWLEVTITEEFRGVYPLEVGANGKVLSAGRHPVDVELLTTPTNKLPAKRLWVEVRAGANG